ncbi:alkaline shock response membrane anchor protein AmaP [Actinomycetospora straminea]|uniref:Alkaline shock response membrane anchor protein AmaP n=1 Tax=Actinomycetospora straminea TaxID=663607 RepID=A0ABP9DYH8_9PSEU|nr:alkaline shock response membrane anchor protein AmaP [Actinomycetospora straminea]MDD7934105.1 alkaline shock response membrane anchor protein AmaP [Actinomycetospora straminea]
MSRRSRRAVARSAGRDRVLTTLLGLVLVAAAVLTLLVSYGVFGTFRAQRPVIDPLLVSWIGTHATATRWIAIGVGVVLFVVGIAWVVRSLRPEPRPDVALSELPGERLVVEHAAVADAVRHDAETIDGVSRARVRLVGTPQKPALRIALTLVEGTDVRDVWADLDGRVLARAREAFAVSALPTAVRLELDASAAPTPARVE